MSHFSYFRTSLVYPIVFLDGMYSKARINGKVETQVVYNIIGITVEGKKEVLGFYLCETTFKHCPDPFVATNLLLQILVNQTEAESLKIIKRDV